MDHHHDILLNSKLHQWSQKSSTDPEAASNDDAPTSMFHRYNEVLMFPPNIILCTSAKNLISVYTTLSHKPVTSFFSCMHVYNFISIVLWNMFDWGMIYMNRYYWSVTTICVWAFFFTDRQGNSKIYTSSLISLIWTLYLIENLLAQRFMYNFKPIQWMFKCQCYIQ